MPCAARPTTPTTGSSATSPIAPNRTCLRPTERSKEIEMKSMAVLLGIGTILFALSGFVRAQDPIVAESEHDLDEAAAVSVDSVVGSLRILTGDLPKAHLKTVKRGRDAELVTFQIESDRKQLRVET